MYFIFPLDLLSGTTTNAINDTITYPNWATGTYAVGDKVNYNAYYYNCITAHTTPGATTPDVDTTNWEVFKLAEKYAIHEPSLEYTARTTALQALTYEIAVTSSDGPFNTIALLNLTSTYVRVKVEDTSNPGTYYYDNEFDMTDTSMIGDYYDWFFTPTSLYKKDLFIFDLSPYPSGSKIYLEIGDATQTATLGVIVVGLSKYVGIGRYGSTLNFANHDTAEEDATFSSAIINERYNIDKYNYSVKVKTNRVQYLKNLFGSLGSSPSLFYVNQSSECLYCYGFYKSFDVNFGDARYSDCNLQVQKFELKPVQDYYPIR